MKFVKEVIRPGVYETPQGVTTVDERRIEHWHDALKRMLENGIRVPLVWGHRREAVPGDEQFFASKYAAGSVTDVSLSPEGGLVIQGDAPGVVVEDGRLLAQAELPSGEKVTTAIEDVSIGVRDWVSGSGELYEDAPIHVALTPLPVATGTAPFEPAEPVTTEFSTFKKPAPIKPKADDDDGATADAETADGDVESDVEQTGPEQEPIDKADDAVDGVAIPDLLGALARVGIRLPDNTTRDNILDRLYVAVLALEPAEETEPEASANAVKQQPTEPAETFFSAIQSDPRLAAMAARIERDQRERRLQRIAKLRQRGLPVWIATRMAGEATMLTFSVDKLDSPEELDRQLDLLEAVLPESANLTAEEVAPPEEQESKQYQQAADDLVAANPFIFQK